MHADSRNEGVHDALLLLLLLLFDAFFSSLPCFHFRRAESWGQKNLHEKTHPWPVKWVLPKKKSLGFGPICLGRGFRKEEERRKIEVSQHPCIITVPHQSESSCSSWIKVIIQTFRRPRRYTARCTMYDLRNEYGVLLYQ